MTTQCQFTVTALFTDNFKIFGWSDKLFYCLLLKLNKMKNKLKSDDTVKIRLDLVTKTTFIIGYWSQIKTKTFD